MSAPAYRALARKWRPQTFSEVVGQEAVVQTLTNAIAGARIHHAYLFTGLRGVGKTTLARILAKALDCVGGPTVTPCGVCDPCREIAEGVSLDVREIDAASNTGVDDVRELIENIRYAPARDRYKVYIVDEVHMLSTAAFNALLKTLEEPPPYAVFVLATTELAKIPATVVSRTQQFDFRRLDLTTLVRQLGRIVAAEGVTVSDAGLGMLAKAGGGSLRDAITLLDQAIVFAGDAPHDEDLAALLGIPDIELLAGLFEAIREGRAGDIVGHLAAAEGQGIDMVRFYGALVDFSHQLLMARIGHAADAVAAEGARVAQVAALFAYEDLLRLTHILLEAEPMVKRGGEPRIALEVTLLRGAELPKLALVEELLAKGGAAALPPGRSAAPRPLPAPSPARVLPAPGPASAAVPAAPPAPAPEAPSPPVTSSTVPGRRPAKPWEARLVKNDAGAAPAAGEVAGAPAPPASAEAPVSRPATETPPPADELRAEALAEPLVQKTMELFKGEITDVRREPR